MSEETLPFLTRFAFAWLAFFRILFDGAFASRLYRAREVRELPPAPPPATPAAKAPPPTEPALQLLAMFQREGRLVDFLEQDIASFSDADVGAAARVVHEGCRKALRAHATIAPIRTEEEGVKVTLAEGFAPQEVKLTGNVQGSAPYTGVLRHRGWRATSVTLPTAAPGHDANVIAPAEIEL